MDPGLADYFRQAPRFTPGAAQVALSVNGRKVGQVAARFGQAGSLCFTPALLRRAGLVVPPGWSEAEAPADTPDAPLIAPPTEACRDYRQAYPQLVVNLKPQEGAVELLAPTDALQFDIPELEGYVSGGAAGLLNYDIFATRNAYAGGASTYLQASTELGFNAGDWIVRSRQIMSSQDGLTQWSHVYAYAQRTLVKYRSILQAGQIDITNSVLSGAPLFGVQIFPESALYDAYRQGPMVEGIARTQARVEVRQNGTLIYSTMVPPGPFALRDVPITNLNVDLEVSVVEASGPRQHFVIPAASLAGANLLGQAGYSFAVGKVRGWDNSAARAPWVITGSRNWALNQRTGLSAGLMAANGYHAAGAGVSWQAPWQTVFSLTTAGSWATRERVRGVRAVATVGARLPGNVSLNLSATQQTPGYRELVESMWMPARAGDGWHRHLYRFKGQYTAALGWSHPMLGSISAGYTRASVFNDPTVTQRLTMSWGRTFRLASVSLNVQQDLSGHRRERRNDNAVYLNVSIPLGQRSVSGYVNRTGDRSRAGVSFSDTLNENINYGVSADTNIPWRDTSFNGNVNWQTRYAQVGANYGRYGSRNSSYSTSVRGSAVAHRHGLTFSPYNVDDTFGVISLGGLSGVQLQTPNGPVWTDRWGRAVIANMAAYKPSSVQVITHTLPRNVDIENGLKTTQAGHGAVTYMNFGVVKVRRLLLTTSLPDGTPLPKGSSIVDDAGNFVTAAGDNGTVFVPDGSALGRLNALLPEGRRCVLDYQLPDEHGAPSYYETVPATCAVDGQTAANEGEHHDQ